MIRSRLPASQDLIKMSILNSYHCRCTFYDHCNLHIHTYIHIYVYVPSSWNVHPDINLVKTWSLNTIRSQTRFMCLDLYMYSCEDSKNPCKVHMLANFHPYCIYDTTLNSTCFSIFNREYVFSKFIPGWFFWVLATVHSYCRIIHYYLLVLLILIILCLLYRCILIN